jgi:hypothetical protein
MKIRIRIETSWRTSLTYRSAADGQILSFCYFLLVVTVVLFVHCLDGPFDFEPA